MSTYLAYELLKCIYYKGLRIIVHKKCFTYYAYKIDVILNLEFIILVQFNNPYNFDGLILIAIILKSS